MIYTSYFQKSGKLINAISVSKSSPSFFEGELCRGLAPTWELINNLKSGLITEKQYTIKYLQLLKRRKLKPKKIAKQLDNHVLLCWEKTSEFCHRHIIADWLKPYIKVKEL